MTPEDYDYERVQCIDSDENIPSDYREYLEVIESLDD